MVVAMCAMIVRMTMAMIVVGAVRGMLREDRRHMMRVMRVVRIALAGKIVRRTLVGAFPVPRFNCASVGRARAGG